MQCVYAVDYVSSFLKRVDFYKAHRSEKRGVLIGQLSSALWLAE